VQAPWLCANGWALNRTFASESSLNGSCFIAGNFCRCSTSSSALRWQCIARRAGKSENRKKELSTLLSFHSTSHFYIGGDLARDSDDVHVTVSNVLLYNRIMSDAKLKALMKKNTVATPEAKVPASKGASQNNHASEALFQFANEAVVVNEARQYATSSSPQIQHSPAQPLGNKNGPAASMQISFADVIGPSTSAGTEEVKEEEPSSGGMVLAFSQT
ncbi:putative trans-sialidase, partial [Trypanosoma cruzi]